MDTEQKDDKDKKHIKVTIIWGGTGESKEVNVELTDTAGMIFDEIYSKFHQKATDQDTFEVNDKDFPRAQFSTTVGALVNTFGDKLTFEVIPPTSGA